MKKLPLTSVMLLAALAMGACGGSTGASSGGSAGTSGGDSHSSHASNGGQAGTSGVGTVSLTSASSGGSTRASSTANGGQSTVGGSSAIPTSTGRPDASPGPGGAAGGTGGAGGTTSQGGTSASGGSGGSGGGSTSTGPSNGLSPQEVVKLMSPGWNLGNSFDAIPNETSWGNPTPNQALIKAVHAAGFKLLRLAVGWTDHIGAGPNYTIDAAWMNKVKQTAQWAIDDGMYVFLNTHHDSDGGNGGWVTFGATSAAQNVANEVKLVWTQIAEAFKSFDSKLMFECFNEPNYTAGRSTQAEIDLNMYLEACYKAIRDSGGANSTRIVMIQPIGASPIQAGIQNIQKVSFINEPNLVISLHTYYPTNFGLSTTPYSWGSASDYTKMQDSIAKEIRVWLPTQVIFVGEWGSMNAQPLANRAAHAQAYAQDTTTAGIVPIWWDNGGSGNESFSLFNRQSGATTQPTIVNGIMTGVKNGLASPNNWAKAP